MRHPQGVEKQLGRGSTSYRRNNFFIFGIAILVSVKHLVPGFDQYAYAELD